MSGAIELRGFMGLVDVFKARNWPIPYLLNIEAEVTGSNLLMMLSIEERQVEIFFINGKVFLTVDALVKPGDRVALVPPGTPGPYRVLLGFVKK